MNDKDEKVKKPKKHDEPDTTPVPLGDEGPPPDGPGGGSGQ